MFLVSRVGQQNFSCTMFLQTKGSIVNGSRDFVM